MRLNLRVEGREAVSIERVVMELIFSLCRAHGKEELGEDSELPQGNRGCCSGDLGGMKG